jgi:uncharacterized RDD family membrane protein YckC
MMTRHDFRVPKTANKPAEKGSPPTQIEYMILWLIVFILFAASLSLLVTARYFPEKYLPLAVAASIAGVFGTFFCGVLGGSFERAFGGFCLFASPVISIAGNGADEWTSIALNIVAGLFSIVGVLMGSKRPATSDHPPTRRD